MHRSRLPCFRWAEALRCDPAVRPGHGRHGAAPRRVTESADAELEFYERFFLERDLEPYPVQEEAFGHIFAGRSVLVTVPTGTGKTMMAKAALQHALALKRTAVYTTPLRALTEEKYRELVQDFGAEHVGFATGDFRVNPEAPLQVQVAEILWNRIYGEGPSAPADVVIMDEGHYFNDPERGYVWEQSIIGLPPETQLVILSATVGYPEQFCQWVYTTRGVRMELVKSDDRKVPLYHEYAERYLVEVVKTLYAAEDFPALIFTFGRVLCFERARLLRSCPRFVDRDEQKEIEQRSDAVLLPVGQGPELKKLLLHGIGVHHAGVLPVYRRLVEELTADRLLKFVVTTETIAAGINLPAKRVVFPSLRKVIKGKPRLLFPAEYHQMAGRAGRPQFDSEGIAITLAPEDVVQEFRKEIRDAKKRGHGVDEERAKKRAYQRAKTEARTRKDVTWDPAMHAGLVEGQPAALASRTRVTAEQILAIGLPDLTREELPGQKMAGAAAASGEALPGWEGEAASPGHASPAEPPEGSGVSPGQDPADRSTRGIRCLDMAQVIERLLLPEPKRRDAHRRLALITANLQALGVLNGAGRQVDGDVIGQIRGMDGVFVWYCLTRENLEPEHFVTLLECVVEHDAIQRIFDRRAAEVRRQWILARLRERRRENPQLTFEDVEEEYWEEHPPELSVVEQMHRRFEALLAHPELHGGKVQKAIWAEMATEDLTFTDYVEKHELGTEEGSLFTYLARVMKAARMLHEVMGHEAFAAVELAIRGRLAAVDERVLEGLW